MSQPAAASCTNLGKHFIAAADNMTLKQLLAKNPRIKDPDKIAVGQKNNR